MERRMISIYAPRPLDTELWGPSAVEIFDYVPGSGIAAQLSRTLLLAGIELDAWLRTITASIDAPPSTWSIGANGRVGAPPYSRRLRGLRTRSRR
jgi:hypothetical protein